MFYSDVSGVMVMFDADDLMILGEQHEAEKVFRELQERTKLREVGRLSKEGETSEFLNRHVRRTAKDFADAGTTC